MIKDHPNSTIFILTKAAYDCDGKHVLIHLGFIQIDLYLCIFFSALGQMEIREKIFNKWTEAIGNYVCIFPRAAIF